MKPVGPAGRPARERGFPGTRLVNIASIWHFRIISRWNAANVRGESEWFSDRCLGYSESVLGSVSRILSLRADVETSSPDLGPSASRAFPLSRRYVSCLCKSVVAFALQMQSPLVESSPNRAVLPPAMTRRPFVVARWIIAVQIAISDSWNKIATGKQSSICVTL